MNMKRRTPLLLCFALALVCFSFVGNSDSYLRHRVVKIEGNGISCTGEQVRASSGVDYVLTAGHCNKAISDGSVTVVTEDGMKIQRRVIAEDPTSDLLLLEGLPNLRGLDIAERAYPREVVRTMTHGGGKPTYETDGVLLGLEPTKALVKYVNDNAECVGVKYAIVADDFGLKVCVLSVEEMVTTAGIIPGSSGGPVMNTDGELVGVASMTDGMFGYLVKLSDIRLFLAGY